MKKVFLFISISLSVAASGQNLNQTVRIDNQYSGSASVIQKQGVDMSVPDSLKSFDYEFDYSIFEKPYKGSFEFVPYMIDVRPEMQDTEYRKLYLRAGAGYQLNPVLNAVWQPLRDDRVNLTVHQNLDGWCGLYRTVRKDITQVSPLYTTQGVRHHGYDLNERVGADADFSFFGAKESLSVAYQGLFNRDEIHDSNFHSISASAGVKSPVRDTSSFYYDFNLGVKLSQDSFSDDIIGLLPLVERLYSLDGTVAPKSFGGIHLNVDFRMMYADYSANGPDYDNSFFAAMLLPRVDFAIGKVGLSAGLRLDVSPLFRFFPDIRATLPVNEHVKVYAQYSGGNQWNTYSSLKEFGHWFFPGYNPDLVTSIENMNVRAGASGSFFSRLQYDVKAGFAVCSYMPMWGVSLNGGNLGCALLYRDYNLLYARLLLAWKSDKFDADCNLNLNHTNMGGGSEAADLPLFSGSVKAAYRWRDRLSVGTRARFETARPLSVGGVDMELLPWFDLGVYGEYEFSRRMSFWIQGGNLLNQSIQLVPMHVENGINFTAGVVLKL